MQARELQRPLGQAELDDLSEFLSRTPGAMPFSEAHGFLTAIASAPTTMMPSVWQPVLLGERGFSSMEQAKHVLGLVMRLYNQILTDLNEGNPIARPDPDEDVGSWCTGYLKAARMDEVWTADETGVVYLFPLAVLAGEVDLVGAQDSSGKVIEDPAPHLQRCREGLDDTVHEANEFWTAWRRKSMAGAEVVLLRAILGARRSALGARRPKPTGTFHAAEPVHVDARDAITAELDVARARPGIARGRSLATQRRHDSRRHRAAGRR